MKTMRKRIAVLLGVLLATVALALVAACGAKHTLNFVIDGTTETVTASAGAKIETPSEEKEGYVFDGWYLAADFTGEKQEAPAKMPNEDKTYYARFLKQSTLTVSVDGVETEYTVTEGTPLLDFLADKEPSPEGMTFGGWFIGDKQIAEGDKMGAADAKAEARFQIAYTLKLHRMSRTGDYPTETTEESRTAWLGESVDPVLFTFDHFTVDADKTSMSAVTIGKDTVIELWLKRNTYYIHYIANEPLGTVATGTVADTGALYERIVQVGGNDGGYHIDGYRFAGWMESMTGELSERYAIGKDVELTEDIYLYAKWDKGYTDRFGGGDLIYLPTGEEGVVYLERKGLFGAQDLYQQGEYDATTRIFTFEVNAATGEELKGRLSLDGTFAYYGDERPGEYRLIDAYAGELASGEVKLTLDEYDGATLSLSSTESYRGYYTIDSESGDFRFYGGDDAPAQYRNFFFMVGTFGTNDVPAFAIRGNEYGIYRMADSEGYVVAAMVLDGYGSVVLLTETASSYSYGYYSFTASYATSREISVQLIEQTNDGGYELGEEQIWRLGSLSGETRLFNIRDEFYAAEAYAVTDKDSAATGATIRFDGYGSGVLTDADGDTFRGTYAKDGKVLNFTYRESGTERLLRYEYDLTEKKLRQTVGEEYGDYYLYNVEEQTLYTTTLHLDGLGNATWYDFRTERGVYVYDAASHIVTCTVAGSSGVGTSEVSFYLTTKRLSTGTAVYKAYLEEVLAVGKDEKGSRTMVPYRTTTDPITGAGGPLTFDGFLATYKGETSEYLIDNERKGFEGKTFLFFYGSEGLVSFLIDDAAKTYEFVDSVIGSYYMFQFNGERYSTSIDNKSYTLVLENGGKATVYQERNAQSNLLAAVGTYALKAGSEDVYVFTPDTEYTEYGSFEFKVSSTVASFDVYLPYQEEIAFDLHSADGKETLVGDGFGNLTYSVDGEVVLTARFEVSDGLYELRTDGEESYKFKIDVAAGTVARASKEARLYTLYDPSDKEELRIVLDGLGGAKLYKKGAKDDDGWSTWETSSFCGGTYEVSDRAENEWHFTSAYETTYPSFYFILPDDGPYICFMKYDPAADGRFVADDWSALILDGYYGYRGGATYVEKTGMVHEGTYSNDGEIVTFADQYGNGFYFKLLGERKFKRLGNEMGEYMLYNPITGNIYAYPSMELDGEGGATLKLYVQEMKGTYAPYNGSSTEYVFTYQLGVEDDYREVTTRFRILTSGNYKLFIQHVDAMDGTFTTAGTGTLAIDGYYNAVYTDKGGVKWEGYYYSYEYVPTTDDQRILVTFMGLKEGGSVSVEEDVLIENFLIDRDGNTLEITTLAAGTYGMYSPRFSTNSNVELFVESETVAYYGTRTSAAADFTWELCTEFDITVSENESEATKGHYKISGMDAKREFILLTLSDSYGNSGYYFTPFEEEVAGTFKVKTDSADKTDETLVLDGYGDGIYSYKEKEGGTAHTIEGICYFYFSDYVTDYSVVLIDEDTMKEYYFKLDRSAKAEGVKDGDFTYAGEEVNDYLLCVVTSSGGTVSYEQTLFLDGAGKAELQYWEDPDGDFTYTRRGEPILGTYAVTAETQEKSLYEKIWTFTPNDHSGTTFKFRLTAVQGLFSYSSTPCFARFDEKHEGTFTCDTETETQLKLTLDGFQSATYTNEEGTEYYGWYYLDSNNKVVFTATSYKPKDGEETTIWGTKPKATFTVTEDGTHTFTVDIPLG